MIETRKRSRYINNIDQVDGLTDSEKEELKPVGERFAFRTNDYYQSLIDWDDPFDPIRRLIMPDTQELTEFGTWDASDEQSYIVVKGLEHKYEDTALLLVNNVCAAYCRYCFRKRLFTDDNEEATNDIQDGLDYIRKHPNINNVLLTGGDPLVMSTRQLEAIISRLREIDHVGIIRIGTKMLAFDPFRILNDPSLPEMFSRYSTSGKKIYIMAHFSHPRELSEQAVEGMAMLQRSGAATVNQSPIIRGVNDDAGVISELFERLSANGVLPYYLFVCRPTIGNRDFLVPVEESWAILERARLNLSGLAGQARLCMSHRTGKVEVVGKVDGQIILRYHRAVAAADRGRVMVFPSNPAACWLDDYGEP